MRPHVSGTERVGFSKQDARGNLVVASLPSNFPFPPFAEGVYCERPLDWTWFIPFFLTKILELTLSCVSQATQYSPGMESPRDIQTREQGWLLLVLWQLPCALLQGDTAGLPRYECFAAGFSMYPCHIWHLLLVLWQLSCALLQGDSADLPCYKCFTAGSSTCIK